MEFLPGALEGSDMHIVLVIVMCGVSSLRSCPRKAGFPSPISDPCMLVSKCPPMSEDRLSPDSVIRREENSTTAGVKTLCP